MSSPASIHRPEAPPGLRGNAVLLLCALLLLLPVCALECGTAYASPLTHKGRDPARLTKRTKKLAAAIQKMLSAAEVARAHWGISVITPEGAPIYELNDGQFFAPASNAKLFTTAAAFALLGPDFVSKTYVVQEGTLDGKGRLDGSLRLVGTGDPSLSGRTYPYDGKTERPDAPLHVLNELAVRVASAGIREIGGRIIGDATYFPQESYGPGWAWDDLQWGYGAPVSALTINDNVVYLGIAPGAKPGDPAAISWNPTALDTLAVTSPTQDAPPATTGQADGGAVTPRFLGSAPDFYSQNNLVVTTAAGTPQQIGVDLPPGSGSVHLYGTIPMDSQGAHLALAIQSPAAFAATAFKTLLQEHGVKSSGAAHGEEPAEARALPSEDRPSEPLLLHSLGATSLPFDLKPGETILATHTSPPLSQEATVINKVSQNLHAELLLRELAKSQTGEGSFSQGTRVMRQFLTDAGIDPGDFLFYDGSGLSPKDQVTPRATTMLLAYAARQPWGAMYRATLPVGGVDGSLALRFLQSPLKGKIFAKTGTLAEVNALSGYMTAASGRTVIFSILCNGRRPSSDAERKAIDGIAEAIAAAD